MGSASPVPFDGAQDIEIELKLTGPPAALSDAFRSLNGDATSSRVLSSYYDTNDRRLWSRGYTLRLRERNARFELTLKRQDGNPLERGEWTSTLPEPVADLALVPEAAPRSAIGVVLPEELRPRFTSDIVRTRKKIEREGAVIEVSLDNGHIVSGERVMPVAELELELLGGPVVVMLDLARTLIGHCSLTVGARSKAERGMQLADNLSPAVVKPAKPLLDSSDTLARALTKILAVTARQVLGNLAAADDGRDPEGVHQLRVALRRLRSALTLFKDHLGKGAGAFDDAAKHALKCLGPARDLDVFLLETMPPVLKGNPHKVGIRRLVQIAEERRRAAYDDVRRLFRDPTFNHFLLDLLLVGEGIGLEVRDPDRQLRPIAMALLEKRHKKVLKLGRSFADLTYEERHQVRIALKKLRYACDYFQDIFPEKPTRDYRKRLAALQDDLGQMNDAIVAEGLADRLAAGEADAPLGAALVQGWYRHGLQTIEAHVPEAWREFAEARPFWRAHAA